MDSWSTRVHYPCDAKQGREGPLNAELGSNMLFLRLTPPTATLPTPEL